MAQDIRKALDDKTRKLSQGKIEDGKEHAAYQETQQQLLAIQAEQQQNLAVARAESKASFENNQTLAQAAELGAISAAEAEQAATLGAQAGEQLNPATQQILSKYGAGQPRFQRTSSHSQQVTRQNITINNNITSNTTNDVNVPANTGGPIQGRPLQFKNPSSGDGSVGKFKTWISAAFARQNEEGARRDREYRNRENSLTKSASKMLKKLEDVGKTIGSRMDPRKIGSTWQSQLKTLLLLFGFGYLTSNWTKVLDTVSSIESWISKTYDYFKSGNFLDDFSSKLTYYLGGNEGEKPGDAFLKLLKEIFTDDSPGSLLGGIKGFFSDMWDNRAKAVESIKFPEIDLSNIAGSIQSVGQYLGDIITALLGGKTSLDNKINERVVSGVASNVIEKASTTNADSITKQTLSLKNQKGEEFEGDQGVMSIFYNRYKGLTRYSLNENGSLNENEFAEATVGSASDITRIKDNMKGGDLSEAAGMTLHLNNLYKAAQKSKNENGAGIPVAANFLKSIFTEDELNALQKSKDIRKAHYDVVLKEKTKEDWGREGLDAKANALKVGLSSAAISEVSKLLGSNWAGKITNLFNTGGLSAINPLLGGLGEKYSTEIRRFFENKKRFTIVKNASENDPGYTGIKQLVYEVSPRVIEKAAAKLSTGDFNSTVDVNNRSELQKMIYGHARGERINHLENQVKQYDAELSSTGSYLPWNAPKTLYHQINKPFIEKELNKLYESGKDETGFANLIEPEDTGEEKKESEHRFQKMKERGSDAIYNMSNGRWGTHRETLTAGKSVDSAELKRRKQYLFKLLRNEGLSDGAIAGIIGNLESEGLNRLDTAQRISDPTKKNPKAYSIGIAQFNSEGELPSLIEWSKKNGLDYKTFEAQAQYIANHEIIDDIIKDTFGLNQQDALKKSAVIWGRKFERFVGHNAADNHGNLIGKGSYISVPVNSKDKFREDGKLHGDENYTERIQKGLNTYNTYAGSDLSEITIESSHSLKQEDEEENKKEEKQESFLSILGKYVKEFIFNLGGIMGKVNEKIEGKVSPFLESAKEAIFKDGKKYGGPITDQFTDYYSYLSHQNNLPDELPAGLSYSDWKNRVYDLTGSMPDNLEKTSWVKNTDLTKKDQPLENRTEEIINKYSKDGVDFETKAKKLETEIPRVDKFDVASSKSMLDFFDTETYKKEGEFVKDTNKLVRNISENMYKLVNLSAINGKLTAKVGDAVNNNTMASVQSSRQAVHATQVSTENATRNSISLINKNDNEIV